MRQKNKKNERFGREKFDSISTETENILRILNQISFTDDDQTQQWNIFVASDVSHISFHFSEKCPQNGDDRELKLKIRDIIVIQVHYDVTAEDKITDSNNVTNSPWNPNKNIWRNREMFWGFFGVQWI